MARSHVCCLLAAARKRRPLNPRVLRESIGEVIQREKGTIEYLKTFRLSEAQLRRAQPVSFLSRYDWKLAAAARAQYPLLSHLVTRVARAGFGYLLRFEHLADASRASMLDENEGRPRNKGPSRNHLHILDGPRRR